MNRYVRLLLIVQILNFEASAFLSPQKCRSHHAPGGPFIVGRTSSFTSTTAFHLVPIRKFSDRFTFLSESEEHRCCIDKFGNYGEYHLGLAEEKDLPDCSRFIVRCFGADAIRLSKDIGAFEKTLMTPAIELVNGYSGIVAFAEVLAGLRDRLSFRLRSGRRMDLSPPNLQGLNRDEKIRMAASTSILLVLAKEHSGDKNDWHSDVVASVELQLQPCDAKIPFTLPWIDRIERKLASFIGLGKNDGRDLQPYLSSLCVDESLQGNGVGRALVRAVENIAYSCWGYSRMYLHVDAANKVALRLYKSEGYRDVGFRWTPFWAGKAKDIGYYYKKLGPPEKESGRSREKMEVRASEYEHRTGNRTIDSD